MPSTTHAPEPATPHIEPLKDGLEVITTHANADFDALASMLAASRLYPNALLVFPGSHEKNLRNFFVQSTVYLFNFAKPKEVEPKKIKRLIVVDTRQPERLGPLAQALENEGLEIHLYDHHPDAAGDLRGSLEVVAPVGATATLMTELLLAQDHAPRPEVATIMMLGIHEDTGSLTFPSTTPRDYAAAARLLEMGANLNVVADIITRELTSQQVALLGELIDSMRRITVYGVDITLVTVSLDHYVSEFAVLVHKLIDMENLPVVFALAQMNNRVYLVARSRLGEVNVGEIARLFGGGGHATAASATIKDMTIMQAEETLKAHLALLVSPVRTARDIMVFPVISIGPEGTLEQARDTFTRYDINVLLVHDDAGKLLGYISRQNVSKALHHGLSGYPVTEFMSTEFASVGPEATFAQILPHITEAKQRVLPVVEKGRTIGVITRTDLLNILASETNVPGSLVGEGGRDPARSKNVLSLMCERLPRPIVELLADIGRTADRLGYPVYAVGGFIRDLFIPQENLDIDIVIEGDGIEFARAFAANRPDVRIRSHLKFNSAVLIFENGFKVDVATARLEYYESPAALPVVEQSSLRMDLYRRDFTINTLAVRLNEKYLGQLIDYFHGVKDIKQGFVRVLHNLSFVEDPTRVFRCVRFEQRFGFKVGKLTLELIKNAVKHDFFEKLSGKRLFMELQLILSEEDPLPAITRLEELDLLKFISKSLRFDKRKQEIFIRVKKVRDWFELNYFAQDYEPWVIYFLALFDGLTYEVLEAAADRLVLPSRARRLVSEEKPQADRSLNLLGRESRVQPGRLYYLLKPLSTESILYMMAKTKNEHTRRAVSSYFTQLKHVRTELTGKDLIAMGFTPGPIFKEILDSLLTARLNGKVKTREDETHFVFERYLTR